MKSKDFLKEAGFMNAWNNEDNEHAWTENEWAKIVKTIHRDCKPFLVQAKGQRLYRGLGNARDDFMKKTVRLSDRVPKDMPEEIHTKLNQYFLMKHGAKFRNALFVTGDNSHAGEYGNLYKIYPIGNFEYLWSPKVNDLFTHWEDYAYDWNEDDGYSKENLKKFHNEILKDNYTTENLASAIKRGNEIMLRCRSYYAIDENSFDDLPENWQEMLK